MSSSLNATPSPITLIIDPGAIAEIVTQALRAQVAPPAPIPELMDIEAAAAALTISPATLRALIRQKKVKAVVFHVQGSRDIVRVSRDEVLGLIEAGGAR